MRTLTDKYTLTKDIKINLYKQLLLPRMIEEKMISLLRQGKVSKWFSGIGQEAISVGCTAALDPADPIFTMHRNLGVFTTRNIDLYRLFCQWQGKEDGFTKGRDRSFHFGTLDHRIIGMISHLGPQLSLAAGTALAAKLQNSGRVSLAFTGEGGTSQGEFHEALNVASVWKLPVIYVIENNGYGLSTPTSEQYNCENLADRAVGYGIPSVIIDGNDIEEVYRTISEIAETIRIHPQPWLVECRTFRMRGHEEASGTKYVPQALIDKWKEKDPVKNYEIKLLDQQILTEEELIEMKSDYKKMINKAIKKADGQPAIIPSISQEIKDLFASHPTSHPIPDKSDSKEMRFVDALAEAVDLGMSHHDNSVIMGQDIAEYGGVFKVTEGLIAKYGENRVRNTPLCESAIIGIGLGLSIEGMKSIIEMQFADFVTCGFNQIINNLAKIHYRWGQNADVVIRMPTGGGVGAGPFHSQSNEAWFFHTPGLKIVYPSNPDDAKGLFLAALDDPNPVLFFEHKALYRRISGQVPAGHYTYEIGRAKVVKSGNDATIVTYGMGVHWAIDLVKEKNHDVEIIDLRSLAPLDVDTIYSSVKKTSKVLLLHEDCLTGGIGAEISALIAEHCFEILDAPIVRVGSMDTPVPFAAELETQFMANGWLEEKLVSLINY